MEEEERQEDLQEVRASLRELLLVLLASPKHGVLFSDPEYGCDKSSNPLVTEVSPTSCRHIYWDFRPRISRLMKLCHCFF
jgi:hypothetical protein